MAKEKKQKPKKKSKSWRIDERILDEFDEITEEKGYRQSTLIGKWIESFIKSEK